MKFKLLCMLVSSLVFAADLTGSEGIVMSVRQPLSEVMSSCARANLRTILLLNDWQGLGLFTNSAFARLSDVVTNRWPEVLAEMPAISTNQAERLIVLASGTVTGEERFLLNVNTVADMVLSNKLTSAELQFYETRCSIADHHAASSLIRRYQEPPISNLIMKLNAAGAYPRGVSDIFSGEARELYLDAVHDGVIGPIR